MNPSKDILYLNYEYENKSGFVTSEDFKEYYTKIKEVEQIISYYIYIPKSEAKSLRFDKPIFTDGMAKSATSLFYWVIGIIAVIGIGLIIFVVQSNKNRD